MILFPSGLAQARLGETVDECQNRYGIPEQVSHPSEAVLPLWQRVYLFEGYRVMVWFIDGRSAEETFIRITTDAAGKFAIDNADRDAILKANLGAEFKEINQGKYVAGTFQWSDSTKREAFLSWRDKYCSLSVSTAAYRAFNEAFFARKSEEEAKGPEWKAQQRLKKF